MQLMRFTLRRAAGATLAFVVVWQATYWLARVLEASAAETLHFWGWVILYGLGLAWAVWGVERLAQRREQERGGPRVRAPGRVWNPVDPQAWYYGTTAPRYRQSLGLLVCYSIAFVLLYLLLRPAPASVEPYELPAGGGQDVIAQKVKIQKIVRKKYVLNPFSSILFNPPPIDQVDPQIMEAVQHQYQVGQGAGEGAGFGQGTGRGKVRLIRLKHSDAHWNKNFGVGGDQNLLAEYASRTRQRVAEQPESIDIGQLGAFPPKKCPPMVYVSGARTFQPTPTEKKVLKTYLLERHGMLIGDNLGGQGFHNSFVQTVNEVTGVQPVPVPRDDVLHDRPYKLPLLPIVVAHGGTVPLGWKVDGRWVAYYHPGAMSDAWRDDHAGIRRDIWEACYQLGVNLLFYAHAEYNKWLESQPN